jgi:class 3 adenylate cyclase
MFFMRKHRLGLLLVITSVLAVGLFVFDTASPLEFGVAVLYMVVVLIAGNCFDRRAVLGLAVGCMSLTLLSLVLVDGAGIRAATPLRAAMSLSAILITTVVALKNYSVNERLCRMQRQRASLARFASQRSAARPAEIKRPLCLTRRQPAAVLFVDIVGFTAYCSKITPEDVVVLLRDLTALMSECVLSCHGTIDKFLGDGLMAVFGPPSATSVDATNAARCALEILRSVDRWNNRHGLSGDQLIRVAIGIDYGQIVQGAIGSENRLELTVVGDAVNIASRVETYCRTVDASVLVTAALIDALHREGSPHLARKFAALGQHVLRGRAEPIRLYGVRRSAAGTPTRRHYEATTTMARVKMLDSQSEQS